METITSDQGTKYDIVEIPTAYPLVIGENYIHPQPSYFLQKSSQSREYKKESTAPTESEKKDFGKKLISYMRNEGLFDGNIGSHKKIKEFLTNNGYYNE